MLLGVRSLKVEAPLSGGSVKRSILLEGKKGKSCFSDRVQKRGKIVSNKERYDMCCINEFKIHKIVKEFTLISIPFFWLIN